MATKQNGKNIACQPTGTLARPSHHRKKGMPFFVFLTVHFVRRPKALIFQRAELFSGTYIGQNPSSKAGKYLVLAMDFSVVNERNVKDSFAKVVNASVSAFSEKYHGGGFLKRPVKIDPNDFTSSLSDLATVVRLSGHKLSLIVDEVDSFTNRLLLRVSREKGLNKSGYHEFIKNGGTVLRHFGRVVKAESSTCIERMFFTGIMPVTWSDDFSSLNTVQDLTHTNAFRDALGFKSSDIAELLALRFPGMDPEERGMHLASIRNTCNVYRLSSSQEEGLYNAQGVWYYMKQLRNKGDQMVPRMDPNIVQPASDEVAAFLVKHAAGEFPLILSLCLNRLVTFIFCFEQWRKGTHHCTSLMEPSLSFPTRDSSLSLSSTRCERQRLCSAWLTIVATFRSNTRSMRCSEMFWWRRMMI